MLGKLSARNMLIPYTVDKTYYICQTHVVVLKMLLYASGYVDVADLRQMPELGDLRQMLMDS